MIFVIFPFVQVLPMFQGSMTALITPFRADGSVDDKAFQDFIQWQIAEGTDGLVPAGTTGESATLSHDEHKRVVELAIEANAGRVPLIAGAGSNSTDETIDLARHAKSAGADAVLIVLPYYNRPTQEGLFQHFKAVTTAVDIPIVVYTVPGRTGSDITIETLKRLRVFPNIVAIKDATADLARPLRTRVALGPEFCQLSGEDATITAFLAQGGHGCISVTSNIAPRLMGDLHDAWAAGDGVKVNALRDQAMPLHDAMFLESSPGPVKYAASLLGHGNGLLRLPLVPPGAEVQARVRAVMVASGLLSA